MVGQAMQNSLAFCSSSKNLKAYAIYLMSIAFVCSSSLKSTLPERIAASSISSRMIGRHKYH